MARLMLLIGVPLGLLGVLVCMTRHMVSRRKPDTLDNSQGSPPSFVELSGAASETHTR